MKSYRLEYEVWRFIGIIGIFVITAQFSCDDEEPTPDPCDSWTWIDHEGCSMDRCGEDDHGYECRDGECWCCDDSECWPYGGER